MPVTAGEGAIAGSLNGPQNSSPAPVRTFPTVTRSTDKWFSIESLFEQPMRNAVECRSAKRLHETQR